MFMEFMFDEPTQVLRRRTRTGLAIEASRERHSNTAPGRCMVGSQAEKRDATTPWARCVGVRVDSMVEMGRPRRAFGESRAASVECPRWCMGETPICCETACEKPATPGRQRYGRGL